MLGVLISHAECQVYYTEYVPPVPQPISRTLLMGFDNGARCNLTSKTADQIRCCNSCFLLVPWIDCFDRTKAYLNHPSLALCEVSTSGLRHRKDLGGILYRLVNRFNSKPSRDCVIFLLPSVYA